MRNIDKKQQRLAALASKQVGIALAPTSDKKTRFILVSLKENYKLYNRTNEQMILVSRKGLLV